MNLRASLNIKGEKHSRYNIVYLFIFILIFFVDNSLGQIHKIYEKSGYDEGKEIQVTNDGGFIFIGNDNSGPQPAGILIKTDSDGNLLWNIQLGINPELGERYNTVVPMQYDNEEYIIGGYSYDNDNNEQKLSLVMVDANGGNPSIVWQQSYGYQGNKDEVIQLMINSVGNIIALCRTAIDSKSILTTLEIDPGSGSIIIQSNYSYELPLDANKIIEFGEQEYLIIGTITVDERREIFLTKLNSNLEYTDSYRYYDESFNFEGVAIKENTDPELEGKNNFIVLGRKYDQFNDASEILLFNLDQSNNPWTLSWNVQSEILESGEKIFPKDLMLDVYHNSIITGYRMSEGSRRAFLLSAQNNSNSVLNWGKTYMEESELESEKEWEKGYIMIGKQGPPDNQSFYLVGSDYGGKTDGACENDLFFSLYPVEYGFEPIELMAEQESETIENKMEYLIPELTINDICQLCHIEISATADPDTICQGQMVILGASGAQNYYWSQTLYTINENGSYGEDFPPYSTTYTVTGVDSLNCESTAYVTVIVNPIPSITLLPSNLVVFKGDPITIYASGATNYTWLSANYNFLGSGPSITLTLDTTTSFIVIGSDPYGCNDTLEFTVNVLRNIRIETEGITGFSYSVSGAGINATYASGGIEILQPVFPACGNTSTINLTILPTPVSTVLEYKFDIDCNELISNVQVQRSGQWYPLSTDLYEIQNNRILAFYKDCDHKRYEKNKNLLSIDLKDGNILTPNLTTYYKLSITNFDNALTQQLNIYGITGTLVFQTTNLNQYWDGKVNGAVVPGVYRYDLILGSNVFNGQFYVSDEQ